MFNYQYFGWSVNYIISVEGLMYISKKDFDISYLAMLYRFVLLYTTSIVFKIFRFGVIFFLIIV